MGLRTPGRSSAGQARQSPSSVLPDSPDGTPDSCLQWPKPKAPQAGRPRVGPPLTQILVALPAGLPAGSGHWDRSLATSTLPAGRGSSPNHSRRPSSLQPRARGQDSPKVKSDTQVCGLGEARHMVPWGRELLRQQLCIGVSLKTCHDGFIIAAQLFPPESLPLQMYPDSY